MPDKKVIDKQNHKNYHYCKKLVHDGVLVTRIEYLPECRKTGSSRTSFKANVIWDYPAVAVTSFDINGKFSCSNYSRSVYALSYNKVLSAKLNILDPHKQIGDNRCGNIIGHCAEPHAANRTMNEFFKKHHSYMPLASVFFSVALRPRTLEIISSCQNCKDTFPNL